MHVNNLLSIIDGSVKRLMKIMESEKNGRTIIKNRRTLTTGTCSTAGQ